MISTFYFHPGETPTLVLPINIIDDGSIEGDEYFTLQLQSFDLSIVLVNSIVKILVEDNEQGIAPIIYHSRKYLNDFLFLGCPELKAPDDGSVVYSSSDVGSQAMYSCNQGLTVVGMSTRVCQNEGTWSGAPPVCQSGEQPTKRYMRHKKMCNIVLTVVCTVELDGGIEVEGNWQPPIHSVVWVLASLASSVNWMEIPYQTVC